MLSYQHIYHAGNQADLHKHLWLITILQYLKQKEKPFHWIDTHGGRGLYDLHAPEAQKLKEHETGLFRLLPLLEKNPLPEPLALYRDMIKACQNDLYWPPRYYPGSSLICGHLLRRDDRLFSYDQHKQEVMHLQTALAPFPNAQAKKADGYQHLLKQPLPPSGRGGALIDPSYEIKTEYQTVIETLSLALKRWPQGVFMVWYPLLPAGHHHIFNNFLKNLNRETLQDEWIFSPLTPNTKGLYGSGILLINPPFTTSDTMAQIKTLVLPFLTTTPLNP